jgi:hypothetical protein
VAGARNGKKRTIEVGKRFCSCRAKRTLPAPVPLDAGCRKAVSRMIFVWAVPGNHANAAFNRRSMADAIVKIIAGAWHR